MKLHYFGNFHDYTGIFLYYLVDTEGFRGIGWIFFTVFIWMLWVGIVVLQSQTVRLVLSGSEFVGVAVEIFFVVFFGD